MLVLVCGCSLALIGCSNDESEEELQLPDFLSESEDPNGVPIADSPQAAMLELNLRQGERFPLTKVVEQQLTQPSLTGQEIVHDTRLELHMVISVDAVDTGRTLLGVLYNRVRFLSNIAGEVSEYDSSLAGIDVPPAAAPYHRMIGHGFGFWIGSDNQIIETVGFEEFCNHCVASQQELLSIETSVGERAVADFVDNSIGLLPYGVARRPGESWQRTDHIERPVPLRMTTTYTLSELNESTAVIYINSEYLPSTTFSDATSPEGVRVVVQSGSAQGTCTIFRDSGLPVQSSVIENIQMVVQQSGAIEFPQQLVRRTTIESYPQSGSQPTILGAAPGDESRLSGGFTDGGPVVR
jgi:hypothetical protein